MSERKIIKGGLYKHFKGNLYKVLLVANDTEDNSRKVVYVALKDGKLWVRDYEMFLSLVDKDKYPEIDSEYRFELVEEFDNE